MDDLDYGDGIPLIAGGFLKGITEADIVAIIGGLGDNIEEADRDLEGYDTDKIESKNPARKIKSLIKADTDSSSESSESESDNDDMPLEKPKDSAKELDKKMEKITGGGNVLHILVSLIPTVFPKSYI